MIIERRGLGGGMAASSEVLLQMAEAVIGDAAQTLKHAQLFIETKEKMHPHGVELHKSTIDACNSWMRDYREAARE